MLDHPADVRIEVRGGTIEELFANAAQAFGQIVGDREDIEPEEKIEVEARAETLEDLMVDWLRELLFLHETRQLVPVSARIIELGSKRLRAKVFVRTLAPDEVPPYEIKAVTYHGLSVDRTDEGYVTKILFDI
jgi:SHS2 domain-containing protein